MQGRKAAKSGHHSMHKVAASAEMGMTCFLFENAHEEAIPVTAHLQLQLLQRREL